jgi:hypothetical protein
LIKHKIFYRGEHEGVVYFTPRGNSPTGCSFIRMNKVDLGVDLYTGVEDKYGRVEGLTAGVDHEEIRDLRKEIGARFVEVRGSKELTRRPPELLQHCRL